MKAVAEEVYLTVIECAALWRVSPTYVRREIWAGRLRSTRFGRAVRISRVEADKFSRSQTDKPMSEVRRSKEEARQKLRKKLGLP